MGAPNRRVGRPLHWLATLVGLLALLVCLAQWPAADTPRPAGAASDALLVVRIYYDDVSDLASLRAFDLWEFNNLAERYVLASVDAAGYSALVASGWRVAIDDEAAARLGRREPRFSGFYGQYRTVTELYTDLTAMNAVAPNLTELVQYGESHCLAAGGCVTLGGEVLPGYPLLALRVTNEAVEGASTISGSTITRGDKPIFLLMANIHAREITTPELAMRYLDALLDGYGQDADVTWLVDYHEIWVIPTANPDGHWLVELGEEPDYGGLPFFQRKNANNDTDDDDEPDCAVWPPFSFAQYGIDLNRNHSFDWGPPGSSAEPCDMTYRGPAAASEVEVVALEGLITDLFPDQRPPGLHTPAPDDTTGLFITLHSFSNLVLWPWGNIEAPAPNRDDLQAIGDKFATYNGYTSCQPSLCLYLTNGASDDWAYGELGIPAFTFEIGDDFMPSYSEIDARQWPDNAPAFFYATKIARTPYQTIHGPDVLGLSVAGAEPSLTLTATLNDANNGNLPIAAAHYTIDTPPWVLNTPPTPLVAADGAFDAPIETVTGTIDTSGLTTARHTLFVRGRDRAGNWGPVTAVFFEVRDSGVSALSLNKSAATVLVSPGGSVSYRIDNVLKMTPANHTYTLVLTDTVPADVNVLPGTIQVNGTSRPDIYDPTTRTLMYQQQGLFANELVVTIAYSAQITASAVTDSTIVNEAELAIAIDGAHFPTVMNDAASVHVVAQVDMVYLPAAMNAP